MSTGTELDVREAGEEHDDAALLIHGLGAHAGQFSPLQRRLADRVRTVAVSLRGHGGSRGDLPDRSDLVAALAEDVLALVDTLRLGRVHVVGNSLGGLVGFELLGRRPAAVRSLVTYGTTAELHTDRVTLGILRALARVLGSRGLAALTARTASRDRAVARELGSMVRGLSVTTYLRLTTAIASYDYRPVLEASALPYLLVQGEHDREVNRQLASTLDVVERLPGASHVTLPGAGHLADLERPAAFEGLLRDFWRSVADGERAGTG